MIKPLFLINSALLIFISAILVCCNDDTNSQKTPNQAEANSSGNSKDKSDDQAEANSSGNSKDKSDDGNSSGFVDSVRYKKVSCIYSVSIMNDLVHCELCETSS
jgi:hypothetical protein